MGRKKKVDILATIKKVTVAKLGVDEKKITMETHFMNDLGADSLDTVELVMDFEKEFNVAISDEDAEKISTVRHAFEYMQKHLPVKPLKPAKK